jgi:hypothetical protein
MIPVPRGMSDGFYAFMGAGAPRSESGEILMLDLTHMRQCLDCRGTGEVCGDECESCLGSGRIEDGAEDELSPTIPAKPTLRQTALLVIKLRARHGGSRELRQASKIADDNGFRLKEVEAAIDAMEREAR